MYVFMLATTGDKVNVLSTETKQTYGGYQSNKSVVKYHELVLELDNQKISMVQVACV